MSFDDSAPLYHEPKYKECVYCSGIGMRGNYTCLRCDGSGEVEITQEEIDQDNECRIDDEADLTNDN